MAIKLLAQTVFLKYGGKVKRGKFSPLYSKKLLTNPEADGIIQV